MDSLLTLLWQPYEAKLALQVALGSALGIGAIYLLMALHPGVREMRRDNRKTAKDKLQKAHYSQVISISGLWGGVYMAVLFGLVFPYCLTATAQAWWQIAFDCFCILMFYDFIYYLTHRFLFHGKPLLWMHAIHHQQKKPCRQDASYLHPLESCIGMALFCAAVILIAALSGGIGVVTAILTFIFFLEINQINHDLIERENFPFKYIHYLSRMHHVHHAKFSGGNFATLSLFYDWLFGTYDTGSGWGKDKATTTSASTSKQQ